tara:strand:- start:3498 stop:3947 length:450 start_codon:yes stop_codon:yes gene_type:complete
MKIGFCLIAFVLLISSLYMAIMRKDNQMFINFYNLLDNNQKSKYEYIVKERMIIYVIGMLLGIGLGLFYFMKNRNDSYLFCKVIAIIYLVKLGFYYIFPKSPLMLYHLTTKQQTDAWADIYSEMKNRWKKSLFIGFFGYVFIGYALTQK